ncbi:SKI/DACH domain-containing protein 1 [Platysternon megacephalum]|uniref:SKI/DACH domain-containing protein 1 n=1 Tax=Platysternon megacephalum TaxID=55544 RepID=A0A4D9F2F6_9SAUR|nr:SKI/DACH domain-containing protein 1 [Platysternon megacephalum]
MAPAAARQGGSLCRTACRQLLFGLLVLSLFCEACKKVTFNVPSKLEAGTLVGRVNLKECLKSAEHISSSDPDFRILEDGSLYTTNIISLSSEEKTFTILLKDIQRHEEKKIHVNLIAHQKKTHKTRHTRDTVLRRTKRRWAPIPSSMMENSLGPFPLQIQQVQSDTAQNYTIYYSATGPGIDRDPKGLFYVERETGNVFATGPVDREQYPEFKIIFYATTADGYSPERPLLHTIKIEDDNDNIPCFTQDFFEFVVPEHCKAGTVVGKVTAEDRDEPYTLHTELRYRIVSEQPPLPKMFFVHPESGVITTLIPQLDREIIGKHMLLMEVRDMAGQSFGLCNTGTVVVNIGDINDNAPYFGHSSYEIQVLENRVNVEILRIPCLDKDEPNSPAWNCRFSIVKGNEDNHFAITTDGRTNEGVLCVVKGLDYEITNLRILEIAASNEIPYAVVPYSSALAQSTCTVRVIVLDDDEGPVFKPCLLPITIDGCMTVGTVVGKYLAEDPETGNSEGISYRIAPGQSNWITIDENSGELRTAKLFDNDMTGRQCNITVFAVDQSGKTGTGTVLVTVGACNNYYPIVTPTDFIMCRDRKPVYITAVTPNESPYSAPFRFDISDRSMGSGWQTTQQDDKSIFLSARNDIPFGIYNIPINVRDNSGRQGTSMVTVNYCDCTTPSDCGISRQAFPAVTLGVWAILAMILGSLLLLLILITLCGCYGTGAVSKHEPDDLANQNLIISNTEAPGEEVMDPNIIPLQAATVNSCDQGVGMGTIGHEVKTGGQSFEMSKGGHQTLESVRGYGQATMEQGRYSYSEWQNFMHSRLGEKVYMCRQDEENKHSEDYVLPYNYEGRGSLAGSVGCCSDQQEEEVLDFLDQLEPKFRTLAETCVKR